jgi:diguanylate cyclase (GGDEF)-like protein
MDKPVIICIDDEATVIDSLKIELKRAIGENCIVETAEGGEDAIALMDELLKEGTEVAVVLSDYIMPDIKGDEVLNRIHSMSPNTLTIMLTGQADLEAIGNAIKHAKLYRYIAKPWQADDLKLTVVEALHSYLQDKKLTEQNLKLQQLNRELERLNEEQSKIIAARTAALEQANRELQRLAHSDGLTGLANRRRFDEYIGEEWYRSAREKQVLSLILCDIDAFKQYNDRYGHLQGDDCLQRVARAIRDTLKRPGDLAARFGGEEFAIVLPNTPAEGAMTVAQLLRNTIRDLAIPHESSPVDSFLTVSLGVAGTVPSAELSPLALINIADEALYRAKKQGRDRAIVADSVREIGV